MQNSLRFACQAAFLALAALSIACLLILLVGQKFGTLSPDELVFLSKLNSFSADRLEIGFFTPYFRIFAPWVQRVDVLQDLPFLALGLRLVSLAALIWALLLFWRLAQSSAQQRVQGLAAGLFLALLFGTVGRMIEIRPDGIAIALIAGAWLMALNRVRAEAPPRSFVLPLAVLFLATLLTPRALIFTVFSAPLGLFLARAVLRMSWAAILAALAGLLAAYGLVTLVFFSDVQASLMSGLFGRTQASTEATLSLYVRFVFAHRGIFAALYGLVIVFALVALWRGGRRSEPYDLACLAVAAGLSLAQLLLLFVDARAYEYAYGYGIAGPLALILWLGAKPGRLGWVHAGLFALLMAWQVVLVAATNLAGLNVSWIHVLPKRMDPQVIESGPLEALMPALAPSEAIALRDQHRLRLAICTRIGDGLVISEERHNPFCKDGQSVRSFGTGVFVGGPDLVTKAERAALDELLAQPGETPLAVLWGRPGTKLGAVLGTYLEGEGWQLYDGFALRKSQKARGQSRWPTLKAAALL